MIPPSLHLLLIRCLAVLVLCSATLHSQDEYDRMREKWVAMITGGTDYDPADPEIARAVARLDALANGYWASMDRSPDRTHLWSDAQDRDNSALVKEVYRRLCTLALAYRTRGSALEKRSDLLNDIVSGLDFGNANYYNHTRTTPPGSGTSNWWDWQIGTPLYLNDTTALLYDHLTPTQIKNYMAAVDHHTSVVSFAATNRIWQAVIIGVRGVIVKDSTKIAAARDGLTDVLAYKTSGEGFYSDGTFIQHSLPYNGGYGVSGLTKMSELMYLLEDSAWTVSHMNKAHVYAFVRDSYQPALYRGAMMDIFRGREISRSVAQDHVSGHRAIAAILQLSRIAPANEALALKAMVKAWITADTFSPYFSEATVANAALAKALMSDAHISPATELVKHQQFYRGDRAIHLRPGFGVGLAMLSARFENFEAINSENYRGWYTGTGALYLYNGDLDQYSEDFWPTVDSFRLPGTTVAAHTVPCPGGSSGARGANAWCGGTELLDTYGVSGMELDYPPADKNGVPMLTVTAKKSWFFFDNEVVALGSGITSTDGIAIETIVENRRLSNVGTNAFLVDGAPQSATLGWSQTLTGVSWMHLTGTAIGASTGYYLPTPSTIKALREARTDRWSRINARAGTPETDITRNYLTLWFDHGTNPTNATYSYVLLPNLSSSQVAAYAAAPEIVIIENTNTAHAAKEATLGILAANFWTDAVKTVEQLTVDKKAAVMVREIAGAIDVSVSDPTQNNTGLITVELARAADAVVSVSPGVTIIQLAPTIKFTADVAGAKGASFRASFTRSDSGALSRETKSP